MTNRRIIPCLDVKNGRVVKGVNFINLRDKGDPVEMAVYYDREGADELVFLDISASREERNIIIAMIIKTASSISIPLIVGGGIRTIDDMEEVFIAGAKKVSINSAVITNPALISEAAERFGSQSIVVAIDARRRDNGKGWEVYTHGGKRPTGLDVVKWAKKVEELGAGEILLTSMDTDGTRDGYDLELLKTITTTVDIPVIASGGAGKLEDLRDAIIIGKADGVLAASIFHEREYTIGETKKYLAAEGISVKI